MPKKKHSLKIPLEKWLQEQGDIYDLLPEGADSQVKTADEARLACLSLDRAIANAGTTPDFDAETTVAAVMGLFQDAATPEAVRAFAKHGLPRLRKLVREGIAADKDPLKVLTFAVKMLAVYGLAEDADLIVEAARTPCLQDSYLWSIVFQELQSQPGLALPVLERLRRPLPSGFAAVAYLDYANALALEGAVKAHPFDTASGHARLKDWLSCAGETTSYAVSATAALPFVASEARTALVKQAFTHPDARVQLEASWVAARGGDRDGLDRLQKFALDARYSGQAIRYLEDVGEAALIPKECKSADFLAEVEMCQWLEHPNEYGRPPDKIELANSKEIFWPPTKDRRRLWVFRYNYAEEDGVHEGFGMTGSITWSMMGDPPLKTPDEVYAMHCVWELQHNEDPSAPSERTVQHGRKILRQFNPGFGTPKLKAV